jgi:hypothetical protein
MNDKDIEKITEAALNKAVAMTPFERWWYMEGSVFTRNPGEDTLGMCERLCAIAWANGVDEEKNREKKF